MKDWACIIMVELNGLSMNLYEGCNFEWYSCELWGCMYMDICIHDCMHVGSADVGFLYVVGQN